MNSDEVYDAIEELAALSGNAKKDLLAKYMVDGFFAQVMRLALDPYVTYGVGTLPMPMSNGPGLFRAATLELLSILRDRTLTGNAARDAIMAEMGRLTSKSASLLGRILLKDLRAGVTAKTVNAVKKGHIPVFSCMLAHKFEEKRITRWPVLVEPKLDGVRVIAHVQPNGAEARFFSRTGKEFTTFDHLKEPIRQATMIYTGQNQQIYNRSGGLVFDGEVVSGSFNKTVSEVRRKDEQATDAEFHVFNIMEHREFVSGGMAMNLMQSRKWMVETFADLPKGTPVKFVPSYQVNSFAEIYQIYESIRERGGEGVIVKEPNKPYQCKRSYAWLKIKAEESEDLRVIGAFEGTGKYQGQLGGLIVNRDGIEVRVGGGFTDGQRASFWDIWLEESLKISTDFGLPTTEQVKAYVAEHGPLDIAGRLIEVEYHEVTPDGSLRHPRFKRWRDDKDDEEQAA